MTLSLTHWLTHSLTDFTNWHTKNNLMGVIHFRHLIRVMRRHDLTKKYLPTYLPTYLCTSIKEHLKGAILETCDLCDIWSEWWEDMTWAKNTYLQKIFRFLESLLKIFRFLESFGKFSDFQKVFGKFSDLKKIQILSKFRFLKKKVWKNFQILKKFLKNFQILRTFSDFWNIFRF